MMERLKVLVAIDESPSAWRALEFAAKRAARAHDDITVLAVLDTRQVLLTARTNPRSTAGTEPYAERLTHLLERAVGAAGGQGLAVRTELRASHDPADEIVRFARDGSFDEIVLGHREKLGVEKIVLGSTALRVLELTRAAVTIVR